MRILLTGASGFIGRRVAAALEAAGHTVVRAARPDVDFARDMRPEVWTPRLEGVDAVVNTVGIFSEYGSQTFQAVHVDTPAALFEACLRAGVCRVIHFSALGADEAATTAYHLSKRRADTYLKTLPLDWTIVQPSLVFGPEGASARFFASLATLPLIPLPGDGGQKIQPIHLDDLAIAVARLVEDPSGFRRVVPLVGATPSTLRGYLTDLRRALGLGRPRFLPIPMRLVKSAAAVAEFLPGGLLSRDSIAMLTRGNTGDSAPVRELLGREPVRVIGFVSPAQGAQVRATAQLAWLLGLLRLSIAIVWIATGVVSLGVYPVESSYELLTRSGVPQAWTGVFLYSASALDILFGLATLLMRRRRLLWLSQSVLIIGYSAIITLRLPEFWLHPYGPMLKNLPMLAAIYLLYRLERR